MKNLPAIPHPSFCSYLLSSIKLCKIIYYWIPGEESRGETFGGRARHRGRPRSACFAWGAVDQYHLVNNFFITTTITPSKINLELKHFSLSIFQAVNTIQTLNRVPTKIQEPNLIKAKWMLSNVSLWYSRKKLDVLQLHISRCPFFMFQRLIISVFA